jgi:hypothetical protein
MPSFDHDAAFAADASTPPAPKRSLLFMHAARFCSVFSTVCNQFRPGRHALSAPNSRTVMRRRWREWDDVSETTAFAVAA